MFLRKDRANNLYYFPCGKISASYKLDKAEEITKVKNVLQTQQTLLIVLLVVPFSIKNSNLTGFTEYFSILVLYIFVHIITSYQTIRKLKKSDITWKQTDVYTEPAKPVTLKGLIFATAGMVAFILLASYLAFYKSKGSHVLAWMVLSFCSVVIFTTVKRIIKKEYETNIPK